MIKFDLLSHAEVANIVGGQRQLVEGGDAFVKGASQALINHNTDSLQTELQKKTPPF